MSARAEQIAKAVDRLDTREGEIQDAAWVELRPLGYGVVVHLRDAYSRFRTWQGRTALAYYSTRYARISDDAVQLGLMALHDRSYMVRYRACGLLAYSLRKNALPVLEELARSDPREFVRLNAQTAFNSIKAQNHHLWADSSLSGKTSWSVNPGDVGFKESTPSPPGWLERKRLGIKPVHFPQS